MKILFRNFKKIVKNRFPLIIFYYRKVLNFCFKFFIDLSENIQLRFKSTEKTFTDIFKKNCWDDSYSRSGPGSNLTSTKIIREELPGIIKKLNTGSILDIPCGDFFWQKETNLGLDVYIGADIVEEIIEKNNRDYRNTKYKFVKLDLIKDCLPKVDVIFCRDCMVHFSNRDIFNAIDNIKRSQSMYLIATTFTLRKKNKNILTGQWRAINLQRPPFYFPDPIFVINEDCSISHNKDKSLAVWKISEL